MTVWGAYGTLVPVVRDGRSARAVRDAQKEKHW